MIQNNAHQRSLLRESIGIGYVAGNSLVGRSVPPHEARAEKSFVIVHLAVYDRKSDFTTIYPISCRELISSQGASQYSRSHVQHEP